MESLGGGDIIQLTTALCGMFIRLHRIMVPLSQNQNLRDYLIKYVSKWGDQGYEPQIKAPCKVWVKEY